MEVSLANLDMYLPKLEGILGHSFVASEIKSFNTVGLNESEARMVEASAHPLAPWWAGFERDIETSKRAGALHLSDGSLMLLSLLSDLLDIEHLRNVDRILAALRNRATFFSGMCETYVAAAYLRMGMKVEIVQESATGEKRCDLRVSNGRDIVYVECKSLDDLQVKEGRQWEELHQRLVRLLRQYQRSWLVIIRSGARIGGSEKESIINAAIEAIRTGDLAPRWTTDNVACVEFHVLSDWGREYAGHAHLRGIGDLGVLNVEMSITPQGPRWRNPIMVAAFPYTEINISRRLISEFKKAYRQIPKDGPGVVHIAIPYRAGSQFLEVVDTCFSPLSEAVRRDTRRVNAVTISALILARERRNQPVARENYIVPNPRPRAELPSWFHILGSQDMGIPMPDREGTVEIWLTPNEPWVKGRAATVFYHCTHDGSHQIRFHQTWNDRFRMDIITPSLGRIFTESDLPDWEIGRKHLLCGTWSDDEVVMYVDGNPISRTPRKNKGA